MQDTRTRLVALVLAGLALASVAPAAELKLAGRTSVRKLMGSQVEISVTGSPNRPVTMFVDVSPGPTQFFGVTFPLGFTALAKSFPVGFTDQNGDLSVTLTLPSSPLVHEVTIYFMAIILDPGAPFGLDISNGVDLTLLDRNIELAGNGLGQYPFFDYVRAINEGSSVELGIDPTQYPVIVGQTADVYVVASKARSEWITNAALIDVTGGPQVVAFGGSTVQANTITLDTGGLAGPDASPGSGPTPASAWLTMWSSI